MEVMHTRMEMCMKGFVKRHSERTWSCAPARSRTLSVLNLRPSERYASAALSSIPISLRRKDSRLPSLMEKGAQPGTMKVWLRVAS